MPVGVEKVPFSQNSENLGDRKCLGRSRKSFVGNPDAILFWRISRKGVFQQPRLFTPTILALNNEPLHHHRGYECAAPSRVETAGRAHMNKEE
jgi:hypothetical protein